MIKINNDYTIEIEDLSYMGKGVGKVDGFTVFVDNALPGDRVHIIIYEVKKSFAFASIIAILTPSKDRVQAVDPKLDTIPLQHLIYPKQLEYKRQWLFDTLRRNIDIDIHDISPTIGMENPWAYRNKAQIPTRMFNQRFETGIFKSSSNEFIPVENYYIQDSDIDKALLILKTIFTDYNISAYNPNDDTGLIKHLIVRMGQHTHEMMIIIVTNDNPIPFERELVQSILEKIPNTVSIIQNINPNKTNIIMGDSQRILFGSDVYMDELMGMKFAISSKSFLQVNSTQTEKLYKVAMDFANIQRDEVWLDAYCGIGTITLSASLYAKHVYGVEIVSDAIKMANLNKDINNIDNVTFEVGKSEILIQSYKDLDGVIVDPPRAGLDAKFIDAILKTQPNKLVYISCDPKTLSRDLKRLTEVYSIEKIQPVDMFPHTLHVETVVLMSRKDK